MAGGDVSRQLAKDTAGLRRGLELNPQLREVLTVGPLIGSRQPRVMNEWL